MFTTKHIENAADYSYRIISGLQVVWHQASLREGFGPHATDWKCHYLTCLRLLQRLKNGTAFQHKNFAPKSFHCSDVRDVAFWNGCILAGECNKLKLLLHFHLPLNNNNNNNNIPVMIGASGFYPQTIQTVPEQHTRKAQNQGTTKNSQIGHCTHPVGSASAKVQNIYHIWNNITCAINYNCRIAATLYTP